MRESCVQVLALIGLSLFAARSATAQEPDDPRLGCWQTEDGASALLLEPGRAGRLLKGKPYFYRAEFSSTDGDAQGVTLETWGHQLSFEVQLEGERLRVVGQGEELWMTRSERVPEALLVAPLELPADVELDEGIVDSVREDLRLRRIEDQRVRTDAGGDPSEMQRVDSDNTEFLRTLIGELGWIDATRFGAEASDAAFLLVQHSGDLRLMRTALPHIEADVRAGRLSGQNYALLFDRLQLNLGYLQRYGSQIGGATGELMLMPCEDIARIDERRAELGMGPLGEYLAYFRSEGQPPIRHLGTGEYGGQ